MESHKIYFISPYIVYIYICTIIYLKSSHIFLSFFFSSKRHTKTGLINLPSSCLLFIYKIVQFGVSLPVNVGYARIPPFSRMPSRNNRIPLTAITRYAVKEVRLLLPRRVSARVCPPRRNVPSNLWNATNVIPFTKATRLERDGTWRENFAGKLRYVNAVSIFLLYQDLYIVSIPECTRRYITSFYLYIYFWWQKIFRIESTIWMVTYLDKRRAKLINVWY